MLPRPSTEALRRAGIRVQEATAKYVGVSNREGQEYGNNTTSQFPDEVSTSYKARRSPASSRHSSFDFSSTNYN